MTFEAGRPQLAMVRRPLNDLPSICLPSGFTLRTFLPGDAPAWDAIIADAFGRDPQPNMFERTMRSDPAFRPHRIWFVCRRGKPVATASAWFQPVEGQAMGTIHMVGVMKSAAGNRLGYWVSLAALHQMLREGRTQANLLTDDNRIPAIKTYLNLGFEPHIIHANQPTRWRRIFRYIQRPDLNRKFKNAFAKSPVLHPPPAPNLRQNHQYGYRPIRQHLPGRPHFGGAEPDFLSDETLYRPRDFGQAFVVPGKVVAGSGVRGPVRLTYVAGVVGLSCGSTVSFDIRGQSPLGFNAQNTDPAGPNAVRLNAPEGTVVESVIGDWKCFRLVSGNLKDGDTVTITISRIRGIRWNPVAGKRLIYVCIRQAPNEPSVRLPEPLSIDIVPGPPKWLEATLPCTRHIQSTANATLTIRDRYDNRVRQDGSLNLLDSLEHQHRCGMRDGRGVLAACGDRIVEGQTSNTRNAVLRVRSNRCVALDDLQLYVGDLHCHDMLSQAEGYPDDVYRFAIEDRRLDFLSLSAQTHGWHSNQKHILHKFMNERFYEPGVFVSFLAFEWQHSAFGDKIVHYLGGDQPFLPVEDTRFNHPKKLYEALEVSDALVISHHPGYSLNRWVPGTDWGQVDDRIERCVEIWSCHGSSEGFDASDCECFDTVDRHSAYAALRRGLRLGFVGSSDSHSGRPGGSVKEPRPYWGGLAAVWAPTLTRPSIFDAIWNRHTYAIMQARIVLRLMVNNTLMGGECPESDQANIQIDVWTPGRLRSIELLKNTRLIKTFRVRGDEAHICFDEPLKGPAFYHCRVTQTDGQKAVASPVWIG